MGKHTVTHLALSGGIGGAILDKLYASNAKILATGTNQIKLDNIKKNYEI